LNKYVRNVLYGFLAWLIPFIASFFFYSREGKLTIDIFLFKSIMIVVGSFSAAILLVSYFRNINVDYFKEGIIVGMIWFGISIVLDLLILIPMSGMSITDYFMQIGLRYLAIPAISIAVGTALKNKK
jgi:signal transduction histidine kinase